MSDSGPHPAAWYADPLGRHEFRYWDGTAWTGHVSTHGRRLEDPPTGAARTVEGGGDPERIRRQVRRHEAAAAAAGVVTPEVAGDGTIYGEPILVVNQKAKLIEVHNEYAIYDRHGTQLGAVRQIGQSGAKKAVRVLTSLDQFLTHKLQVVDMAGTVSMQLTRPAKLVRSRVLVTDGRGAEIGAIVQENVVGRIRFALEAGGERIGGIRAENWRAWNFSLRDADDTEVARITKTFEGVARTLFTTADNYVLAVHRPLEAPLRHLVVAAALSIDTALKQDNRGLG